MNTYAFEVKGAPQAKGSARAFVVKGRPVITSTNKNVAGWERDIRTAIQDWPHGVLDSAFVVTLRFSFIKPVSARKREYMTVRPDADKLARAALDALTGVIYRDDSQVVSLTVNKEYGDTPGLTALVMWG